VKIVELGKFFPPNQFGGIEMVAELFARALAEHHDVTVICHNNRPVYDEEVRDGFKLIRCATEFFGYSQPVSLRMGRILRRTNPDLILLHAPNFWAALMVELYCPRVPVVVIHHADVQGRRLLKSILRPLYRRIVRRSRLVIVASKRNVGQSVDLPKPPGRVCELPFGVDETAYELNLAERAQIVASKKELFGDSIVVGFVGRFAWYKGLSVLLKAVRPLPEIRLLLVGDGSLRAQLTREAEGLGIADRIRFVGHVSEAEKVKYLHMMDMFVLPSTHVTEAFGIVQIEAQFCGRPVIRTDLPTGVRDITIHGVTGLAVPAGDVRSLSDAIAQLSRDSALREQFGRRGRERAVSHFSRRKFAMGLNAEVNDIFECDRGRAAARAETAWLPAPKKTRADVG
jgi:glycosyltransferase involved in cell wall biosynthesis